MIAIVVFCGWENASQCCIFITSWKNSCYCCTLFYLINDSNDHFFICFLIIWLSTSLMSSLDLAIVLMQRSDVIYIFLILLYSLYQTMWLFL